LFVRKDLRVKRFALFLALALATVIVVASPASAHTGTATITCTQVSWSFSLFKDPSTVIHQTVTIDGQTVVNQNFTLVGASGANTINISVPTGTHTVVATASWVDSETGPAGDGKTFTQVVSGCQPTLTCTFTKGYYRNHSSATAAIVNGLAGARLSIHGALLTAAQVQGILAATPGQPGNVTFTSNSLLNLTQQLITALLNVRGDISAAPAIVQTAINAAQAGLTITNGNQITTTLTQTQIGTLTEALSSFNEGHSAGFPHCG
jgi:hypothetical protein